MISHRPMLCQTCSGPLTSQGKCTRHEGAFEGSPRLLELLNEFENLLGSFAYYTPVFGYQKAIDEGRIEPGEAQPLYIGNSGTTARILPGWLAGQGGFDKAMEKMGREKIQEMTDLLHQEIPHFDPEPSVRAPRK